MTEGQRRYLIDLLKGLKQQMAVIGEEMKAIKDTEAVKHGYELTAAADIVGSWIDEIWEGGCG